MGGASDAALGRELNLCTFAIRVAVETFMVKVRDLIQDPDHSTFKRSLGDKGSLLLRDLQAVVHTTENYVARRSALVPEHRSQSDVMIRRLQPMEIINWSLWALKVRGVTIRWARPSLTDVDCLSIPPSCQDIVERHILFVRWIGSAAGIANGLLVMKIARENKDPNIDLMLSRVGMLSDEKRRFEALGWLIRYINKAGEHDNRLVCYVGRCIDVFLFDYVTRNAGLGPGKTTSFDSAIDLAESIKPMTKIDSPEMLRRILRGQLLYRVCGGRDGCLIFFPAQTAFDETGTLPLAWMQELPPASVLQLGSQLVNSGWSEALHALGLEMRRVVLGLTRPGAGLAAWADGRRLRDSMMMLLNTMQHSNELESAWMGI